MRFTKLQLLVPTLLAIILAGGCLNYRVGTTLPRDLRTIVIETFVNESGEPNLEHELQRAMRQEVQREGQLRLATPETAAIKLSGTILNYTLAPMRYDQDRPKTVAEYRVEIKVRINAVERATGKPITSQTVIGDTTLQVGGDLMTARRTALPAATRQAAHEIINAVVSAW